MFPTWSNYKIIEIKSASPFISAPMPQYAEKRERRNVITDAFPIMMSFKGILTRKH